MNILKGMKLSWWQVGIFKVSLITFGIIVGLVWSEFFTSILSLLWVIFAVSALYILYLWWKQ